LKKYLLNDVMTGVLTLAGTFIDKKRGVEMPSEEKGKDSSERDLVYKSRGN